MSTVLQSIKACLLGGMLGTLVACQSGGQSESGQASLSDCQWGGLSPSSIPSVIDYPQEHEDDKLVLVWQDEFSVDGLPDSSKWSYDTGGCGWGNSEQQFYTQEDLDNVQVKDGFLTITAIREPIQGSQYSSARLVSKGKGDWLYGKIEVRAKLPRGRGTWPAIWMLPTINTYGGWPNSGEIDIMEHVGFNQNHIHHAIHTTDFNHTKGTQISTGDNPTIVDTASDEFHIYTVEWLPNRLDFYIDGTKTFSTAESNAQPENGHAAWPFDHHFHLVLNIAIGGSWGGQQGIDDSIFPQSMVIDYVKVYQAQ